MEEKTLDWQKSPKTDYLETQVVQEISDWKIWHFLVNKIQSSQKTFRKTTIRCKKGVLRLENNVTNAKKLWKGINEIIHNKLNRNNAEIYYDDNGNIVTDQKTVANRFNKFYSNVADNLLKNLANLPPSTRITYVIQMSTAFFSQRQSLGK